MTAFMVLAIINTLTWVGMYRLGKRVQLHRDAAAAVAINRRKGISW